MTRGALQTWRLVVPVFWIGIVVALSFIETPLKFLADGITLPIALSVGRVVLTAANITGGVLLVVLTVLSLIRPFPPRLAVNAFLWGLWAVLIGQIVFLRPALNARSDVIIAGGDPGASHLHLLYVAADVIVIALLVGYAVTTARGGRGTPAR